MSNKYKLLNVNSFLEKEFKSFLLISALLTGFEEFDLLGTGLAEQYYHYLKSVTEEKSWTLLCKRIDVLPEEEIEQSQYIETKIFGNKKLATLARNIIKLWYLGQWFGEIPSSNPPTSPILSSESYKEGLVWRAIDAHPAGAKEQGFGKWSYPPNS